MTTPEVAAKKKRDDIESIWPQVFNVLKINLALVNPGADRNLKACRQPPATPRTRAHGGRATITACA
jgi:hypothetical protein